jgi:hypothetical protein
MNSLRGIATGILIATIILGLTFLVGGYSNNTSQGEETEERVLTADEVKNYAKANNLVIISQDQYDQFMNTEGKQDNQEETSPGEDEKPKEEENTEEAKKPEDKVVEFNLVIKSGMSTQEVADNLKNEKIIKDSKELIDYLEKNKLAGAVKAGDHKVTNKMSIAEIAKEITSY